MTSKATIHIARVTIATICLIALMAGSVNALQGTPETEPEATSPDASPVALDATSAAGENQTYFDDEIRPFSDLGYRDRTVSSSQAIIEYYLPLPPGVDPINYSGLELSVSHSPLLLPELSTMTVSANGVAISSVFLDDTNENRARIQVELPTNDFSGDGYHIEIRFSLRLSAESCEPAENQALWATVHADSTYYFSMVHTAGTADLATLDRQFTTLLEPVSIVIPENPSAAELDAAGRIAFDIGRRNRNTAAPPEIVRVSAGSTVTSPAILVGTGAALNDQRDWSGLRWDGSAFQTENGAISADYGVIALTQDPKPVLLVSGATDAALTKAAHALGDPKTARVLSGPFAIVTGENPIATDIPAPWSGNTTTFDQLGIDQREIHGSGSHSIEMIARRPAEWIAGNGGNLTINLQSSPAIHPLGSWMSLSVNGQDIGTTSLQSAETPTSYVFMLPAEAVNSAPGGVLRVEIELHLALGSDPCQVSDPANAWATILADSSWSIPHNVYTGLDLARLPAPFATSGSNDAQFLIALPDAPTTEDIDAALHIASAFGQRTGQQTTEYPRLIRAAEITEDERNSSSIVVLGGPESNSLAASLDSQDALPAVVSQAGTDGVIRLAMIESPWFADGAVLTIGPDAGTDASAVSSLFSSERTLAEIAGTSAIVDPNLLPQVTGLAEVPIQPPDATPTTEATESSVPTPEPTPTDPSAVVTELPEDDEEEVVDEEDLLEGWQVVGSILLAGFVIAIGSFVWIRSSRGPTIRK